MQDAQTGFLPRASYPRHVIRGVFVADAPSHVNKYNLNVCSKKYQKNKNSFQPILMLQYQPSFLDTARISSSSSCRKSRSYSVSVKVDEIKGMSLNGGVLHSALAMHVKAPVKTLFRTVISTSACLVVFLSFAVDDEVVIVTVWLINLLC